MNRKTSLLSLVLMISGWAIAAALADDPKSGSEEWVAPSRAAKKKNPTEANEVSLVKGKTVWVKECASCHGDKGKGDGPAVKDLEKKPGDLTIPKVLDQTDGALFWKIAEGRKPMATYDKTLSEEDRWHVINYMRTLAPKPAK